MKSDQRAVFLEQLRRRAGAINKLAGSNSLFEVQHSGVRVYVRYSKLHDRNKTFYGLRREDLNRLDGHSSLICFLWDGQADPILVPYDEYEDVFGLVAPAPDGQYKSQVMLRSEGAELYIAKAGRFSVEAYVGWAALTTALNIAGGLTIPELSHSQVQTLLGSIGDAKGYDVWIPMADRPRVDWSMCSSFDCRSTLPYGFEAIGNVLQEIDVIWVARGTSDIRALYEVEHSTTIYSALLRFNDVHLVAPALRPTFGVVANEARHALFARQANRPTFKVSGLSELRSFLNYESVYSWHKRVAAMSTGSTGGAE